MKQESINKKISTNVKCCSSSQITNLTTFIVIFGYFIKCFIKQMKLFEFLINNQQVIKLL